MEQEQINIEDIMQEIRAEIRAKDMKTMKFRLAILPVW